MDGKKIMKIKIVAVFMAICLLFAEAVPAAAATPTPQPPRVTSRSPATTNIPQLLTNTSSPQGKPGGVKVKSLKLNKKKLSLKRGTKKTLRCSVRPAAAKGSIKWKSSNKKVATVNGKGCVTAKKVGTAKITAYAPGIKKTCKVTVRR